MTARECAAIQHVHVELCRAKGHDQGRADTLAALPEVLVSHMWTVDMYGDPCFETRPNKDETWRQWAERRAAHIAEVIGEVLR